jgi:hypothetical protein
MYYAIDNNLLSRLKTLAASDPDNEGLAIVTGYAISRRPSISSQSEKILADRTYKN